MVFFMIYWVLGWLTIGSFFLHEKRYVFAATKNIPSSEMSALYDFYTATSGNFWVYKEDDGASWNFSSPSANPCAELWAGIRCQCPSIGMYCHVVGLNMTRMNQSGTLPNSLTNLPLNSLQVRHSDIFGRLPSNIGDFNTLVSIDLGGNRISGSLPDSFYDLNLLANVILANNDFTGTLSSKISQLQALINLDLANNMFNGTLPAELSELSLLSFLLISFNYFHGRLPPEWGSMKRLVILNAQHNFLSGPLPPDYGNMTQLRLFYVWDNLLTGVIPESFFFIENLTVFDPATNFIHGSLPESMGYAHHLEIIELSSNLITGTVPESLNINSTSVRDFSVDRNQMHGTLPYGFWRKLFTYNTGQNFFYGTIPQEVFGTYEIAIVFSVFQNFITGTIPDTMEGLRGMTYFVVGDNFISGTIPGSIRNVSLLAQAFLLDNILTGTIPHPLSNLTLLTQFFIDNNRLTGTIPTELFTMPSLQLLHMNNNRFKGNLYGMKEVAYNVTSYFAETNDTAPHFLVDFDVSYNYLTGTIPDEIIVYRFLSNAIFTGNCLEGTVSQSFCQLPRLQFLALDGIGTSQRCKHYLFPHLQPTMSSYVLTKGLHGTIPSCLFTGHSIQSLHLSGNRLTGSLPPSLQVSTNLTTVVLSHNSLTGRIPLSLQYKSFDVLDLSYNRFYGTLGNLFVSHKENSSVILRVNRLSGVIPQSLVSATNVDILDGNIFNCDSANMDSTAPRSDPSFETYNCASNDIDRSIIAYAVVVGVMVIVVCVIRCMISMEEISSVFKSWYDGYMIMNQDTLFSNVPNVNVCIHWMKNIRLLMAYLVAFIMLVLLPLYVYLSVRYSSYDHVYGWRISAVLLEGSAPGWALFGIYVFLLVGLVLIVYELFFINAEAKRVFYQAATSVRSGVYQPTKSVDSVNSLQGLTSSLSSSVRERASKQVINFSLFLMTCANVLVMIAIDVAYILTFLNSSRKFVLLLQIAVALFKIAWNEVFMWKILQFAKFYCTYRTCWTNLVESENFTTANPLALSANDGDASTLSDSTSTSVDRSASSADQTAVATNQSTRGGSNMIAKSHLDLMWDYTDREVVMMAFNVLLNSITVPCIAVALVNSTCFYNAIVPPKRVDDTYDTFQCGIIVDQFQQSICFFPVIVTHDIGYDPPFTYSYICSSTINMNYTPVYMYMYIILGLVVPTMKLLLHYLNGKYYAQLGHWLDWVSTEQLRPLLYRKSPEIFIFFQRERLAVRLSTCLGVLLSFGVIYPLLALVAGLTGIVMVVMEQILIGCAYNQIPDDRNSTAHLSYVQKLSAECKNMVTLFMKCIYLIMPFCITVLAYTIFDTIGYSKGVLAAIAPVVLLFFLPFATVAALYVWFEQHQRGMLSRTQSGANSVQSVGLQRTEGASLVSAVKRTSRRLSHRLSSHSHTEGAASRTVSSIELVPSVASVSSRIVTELRSEANSVLEEDATSLSYTARNPMVNGVSP